jgi:hypothetical protein
MIEEIEEIDTGEPGRTPSVFGLTNQTIRDLTKIVGKKVLENGREVDKYSLKQLAYMVYLAHPAGVSQKKIAKRLSVCEETLINWRHRPEFLEDAVKVASILYGQYDMLVDKVVLRKALAGNILAAKLYYDRRGFISPKLIINNNNTATAEAAAAAITGYGGTPNGLILKENSRAGESVLERNYRLAEMVDFDAPIPLE